MNSLQNKVSVIYTTISSIVALTINKKLNSTVYSIKKKRIYKSYKTLLKGRP